MMRATRNASLLVALFLLISAATASAECAWVLWREGNTWEQSSPTGQTHEWVIVAVHDARDLCRTDLNDKVAKLAAHARMREAEGRVPQKIAVTDDAVGVTFYDAKRPIGGVTSRFYCLPDTVDPRGPKGGGR
jgi:hypothetical protein